MLKIKKFFLIFEFNFYTFTFNTRIKISLKLYKTDIETEITRFYRDIYA